MLNKTETYDNVTGAMDYWHFRKGNPPSIPNEEMHWHLAPKVKTAPGSALLATDCVQPSGLDRKGPIQHGVRDFSKGYAPFDEEALPSGVVCTQAHVAVATAANTAARGSWVADADFDGHMSTVSM